MNIKITKKIGLLCTITFLTNITAAELELVDEPLFLNQTVPPALAMTLDDSGSMYWGYMPDAINGGWGSVTNNRVSVASADLNTIYFNPNIEYKLPITSDGTLLPQSSFDAAVFDGYYGYKTNIPPVSSAFCGGCLNRTWDMNTDYRMVWRAGSRYNSNSVDGYQQSSAGFNQTGATRPTNTGMAFYYTWNGPANATFNTRMSAQEGVGPNTYTLNWVSAVEEQNFTNWFSFYNTRAKLAKASMSYAFYDFGPSDFKVAWQQINNLRYSSNMGNMPNMNLFGETHREAFYDWLLNNQGGGSTPLRRSTELAGILFEKGTAGLNTSPYWDIEFEAELSCQQNFHLALSDGSWNSTQGIHWNVDNSSLANADGVAYNPNSALSNVYQGTESVTLADTAMWWWMRDLRNDLPENVPRFLGDHTDVNGNSIVVASGTNWWDYPELYWNPGNDPANWQHMVNFNIGIGLQGSLDQENDLQGLRDGSIVWPSTGVSGGKVDDVWHASLNSRGKYFSADDPNELAASLNDVISNIISRKGRASAGSVSSSVISDVSQSFRTGFDTSNWTGFLVASTLTGDGSFGAILWDASCKLTGGDCPSTGSIEIAQDPNSREIFSYSNGTQFDFLSGSIPAGAVVDILETGFIADLAIQPIPVNITIDDVVGYIRGERINEAENSGFFRNRESVLGDIINSSAKIVRGPGDRYDDDFWGQDTKEFIDAFDGSGDLTNKSYDSFRTTNRNRDNVLLVGANDGMLHSFGAGIQAPASGGSEMWAYIPSKALVDLGELVDPEYIHQSYVDATPVVKDAYLCSGASCNWSTVAVGHMRHGGKLFYALDLGGDVIDKPDVLWEFTDSDDPDLGYTYNSAVISRVLDPVTRETIWVAFLPNGYNSTNHVSVMYAINLKTGALLHKWNTNIGDSSNPNGMGAPVAADYIAYNTDGSETYFGADQATDFIYAGDLHGNVYKFNVLDIFTGAGTSVPEILFDGNQDQPITASPRIFTTNDSTEDVMVVFGTGKYIEIPDRDTSSLPPQFMLGLRDNKNSTFDYSGGINSGSLVEQTINEAAGFRTVSTNSVDESQGWKLELPLAGERMVNQITRDNQSKTLIFLTVIPRGLDPCLPGGQSWVMAIKSGSGGSPGTSFFNDGAADGAFVDGLALGANQLTKPNGNAGVINIDTSGEGESSSVSIESTSKRWGRKSWHRILLN